jgi:hypothetical protein
VGIVSASVYAVGMTSVSRVNGLAVTGFVLGIVAVFASILGWGQFTNLLLLFVVLGVVFGSIGVYRARALGGSGRRLGWWGVVLSVLAFVGPLIA